MIRFRSWLFSLTVFNQLLWSTSPAEAIEPPGVEINSKAGCTYLFERFSQEGKVLVGDLVAFRATDGSLRQAYYLGQRDKRLLFLGADRDAKKFTLTLPDDSPAQTQFEKLVESEEQEKEICSPLSVLSCLRRLDAKGGLSPAFKIRLEQDPERLLSEMIDNFGLESLAKQHSPKPGDREGRSVQHDRIIDFLKNNGIHAERTNSIGKVLKHISQGLPVLLSAHVTSRIQHAPDIEDSRTTWQWEDPSLSSGSIPVPKWAPSNVGAHAVTGLAAIPARHFIEGKRILVLDSANNQVNVWTTLNLRFARPKFILFYPAKDAE